MATPLKSVLVTDWSRRHIAGHDLDGGAIVSYDLDTTIVGTEALGRDVTEWTVGDIATLKFDPVTQLAQLRIVTSVKYILRAKEFALVDIAHTSALPGKDGGRHIYVKAVAGNGAVYVLPMLGYMAWTSAWDVSALEKALVKAEARQDKEPQLTSKISHEIRVEEIGAGDERLGPRIEEFNKIFYSGSRNGGTVFDKAAGLTIRSVEVKQAGTGSRAQMFLAAYVKKTKELVGLDKGARVMRGTAFSQPYFVIDGERVFLRTSLRTAPS